MYLENISKNSNPRDNFYIVVNGTNSKIKNTFSPALIGKGYEVALIGLCTYYSYPNVDETNNTIILTGGGHHTTISLPRGCYELDEINESITKLMKWTKNTAKVVIGKNKITLRASLLIKEADWSVEFPKENSLGTVLGFGSKTSLPRLINTTNGILPHTLRDSWLAQGWQMLLLVSTHWCQNQESHRRVV